MSIFWMIVTTLLILQISVFCTTIYLHRTKTHRALELHPAVGLLMHLHLSVFTGIVPRQWAAVHRKHHHFSDQEGDPHSPRIYGLWTVLFGNYYFYKKEAANLEVVRKYTPDWKNDLLDGLPFMEWAGLVGLGVFMLLFGLIWGPVAWLAHAVLYVLLNATINSVCHMIGYRNFDNGATNLQWVAWITAGEGLHNNHHEHPTSALFALRGREVDPAWPVVRVLVRLGLAKVQPLPLARAAA
ncbi:MAG: fatty acid desaturase [Bryobacteraceae bacterium]|nr:fatty acid desaturase [Bryobacterales bacterium]